MKEWRNGEQHFFLYRAKKNTNRFTVVRKLHFEWFSFSPFTFRLTPDPVSCMPDRPFCLFQCFFNATLEFCIVTMDWLCANETFFFCTKLNLCVCVSFLAVTSVPNFAMWLTGVGVRVIKSFPLNEHHSVNVATAA